MNLEKAIKDKQLNCLKLPMEFETPMRFIADGEFSYRVGAAGEVICPDGKILSSDVTLPDGRILTTYGRIMTVNEKLQASKAINDFMEAFTI